MPVDFHLIESCANGVHPVTMAHVVRVESRGEPYAINDNRTGRAYFLPSKPRAVETARYLLRQGHRLALGPAQVSSIHLSDRLTLDAALDPCTNIREGARILGDFYRAARQIWQDQQTALRHALMGYNTGSLYGRYRQTDWAGRRYLARIGVREAPSRLLTSWDYRR